MATKKSDTIEFEYAGMKFEAVRSEMESWETNKQLALGGAGFYAAVSRVLGGRDVEYGKLLDGKYDSVVALVNAAFDAYRPAKN